MIHDAPVYISGMEAWITANPDDANSYFGLDRNVPVAFRAPKRSVLDKLRASWYALREVWS